MNIGILLAGGVGKRLGTEKPKQFLELSGKMMFVYSFGAMAASGLVDDIIIVADEAYRDRIEDALAPEEFGDKFLCFAEPGENRQLSIYNALNEIELMGLSNSTDIVLIQDAARPFTTTELIEQCIQGCYEHEGAMPCLPMCDTVYFSKSGKEVEKLLDRGSIYAGQAPEAFRFKEYYEANKALLPKKILGIKGSTEPAVKAGMDIAMIEGDQNNFKITTCADFERAVDIMGRGMN